MRNPYRNPYEAEKYKLVFKIFYIDTGIDAQIFFKFLGKRFLIWLIGYEHKLENWQLHKKFTYLENGCFFFWPKEKNIHLYTGAWDAYLDS